MTDNNYCKDGKCSQKKHKFTISNKFVNNGGTIITFEVIAQDGNDLSIDKVCNLLNELNEENERLKQEIQGCKDDRTRFEEEARIDAIDNVIDEENEKLRKENEELKIQLTVEEMDKEALTEQTAIDIEHYTKQNEKLQDQISMLKTTIARNEAYIHRLTSKGEWGK